MNKRQLAEQLLTSLKKTRFMENMTVWIFIILVLYIFVYTYLHKEESWMYVGLYWFMAIIIVTNTISFIRSIIKLLGERKKGSKTILTTPDGKKEEMRF